MPKIKSKMRKRRRQQGLTLADLASVTNLSPSTIERLETGTRRPGVDNAFLIADALEIDTDKLWRPIVKQKKN